MRIRPMWLNWLPVPPRFSDCRNHRDPAQRCSCMNYECELKEGRHLEISNDGDKTVMRLSNRDTGQRQSQGKTFQTGKWLKTPAVFRVEQDIVVLVETSE